MWVFFFFFFVEAISSTVKKIYCAFLTALLRCYDERLLLVFADLQPMILTSEGEEYSVVERKGVTMHCKVFSSPPSTITW